MFYEVNDLQDDGPHHRGRRLCRDHLAAFNDEDAFGL